jgi:hypothetical protein
LNKIAATSLLNVGVEPVACWAVMLTPAAIAMTKTAPPKTNTTDLILDSFVSCFLLPSTLMHSRRAVKDFHSFAFLGCCLQE